MSAHPSFLALDQAAAGKGETATHEHLAQCPQCQAHVARLEQPVAVPAWAKELGAPAPRRSVLLWLTGLAVATASAAFLLVPVTPTVQAKGDPALRVHVKRGERVLLWNGTDALRPGDVLRLELAAGDFSQLTIATEQPDGSLSVLHRGAVDPKQALLPTAWTLDDEPRDDVLWIALSAAPLTDADVAQRAAHGWSTRLVFRKAR